MKSSDLIDSVLQGNSPSSVIGEAYAAAVANERRKRELIKAAKESGKSGKDLAKWVDKRVMDGSVKKWLKRELGI